MLHLKLKCSSADCPEAQTKLGIRFEDELTNIHELKAYLADAGQAGKDKVAGFGASMFGYLASDLELERIQMNLRHPHMLRDLSYYFHKSGSLGKVLIGGTAIKELKAVVLGIPSSPDLNSNFFMLFSKHVYESTYNSLRGKYVHKSFSYKKAF
ncbi:MAG: hypothetical protein NXH94_03615 [Rhodobacteraceae bacterium]|nr:hypothetical protein [Paracoccaceae bacterium]PWL35058.1 MAG: hypothetical protein DCO97_11240 [Marivita sp. XM-24bin2]